MRILIVCVNLNQGGIRNSLKNLLECTREYPIDYELQVLTNRREDIEYCNLLNKLFPNLKVLDKQWCYSAYYLSYKEMMEQRRYTEGLIKALFVLIRKVAGSYRTLSYISKLSHKLKDYDIAISYDNDIWTKNGFSGGSNRFVLERVHAKIKIGWIHSEPSYYGLSHDIGLKEYSSFDAIVNVSYACKKKFDEIVPEYSLKSFVVHNGFNVDYIKNKSNQALNMILDNSFRIITVSRLTDKAKRSDRILDIANILKKNNIQFSWYIVGDGPLRQRLEDAAREEFPNLHFLGDINEPYNIIRACDLFVLPSEQESFGMVLGESLICGTPVICTNYAAAEEIVRNGKNGIICENSVQALSKAIMDYIRDPKGMISGPIDYSNESTNQFIQLVGGFL